MGLLLVLGAVLLAVLCPRASSQITTPLRLPPNVTGLSDTLSYVLTVEGKPYTIHLQKHLFLPDDFRIYVSDESGSLMSDSTHIKGDCYYRGSIEGVPGSAVTLSTCAGLRGLLQFHNASYGIEPLGSSPTFEHFVYRMSNENTAGFLFAQSHPRAAGGGLQEPPSEAAQSPKYIEVYVVLDKALYCFLGSDRNAVTQKMIQVFNFVNSIFNALNVTVVLSSLELWVQQNKIPTAGAVDELLQRFLQWKQSHLTLQPHNVACLFVYRDQADFVVAASPGTLCHSDASGAVAVLQRAVTLESFSVLLAQLLGRSLGMGFDDGRGCRCPTRACIMESAALGHGCEHGTGYCYHGHCQSAELQCQRLYGRGSRSAPVVCYEELNSQRDRFGHCGYHPRHGYRACAWRNLRCGKLICTYPHSTPLDTGTAAVVYARVREHLCVSLDFLKPPARLDSLLVPPGTKCGSEKVCINNTCHPHSVLGYDCSSEVQCHGHGVCNNRRHCHCHPGWKPPDCRQRGSRLGGSVDSGVQLPQLGEHGAGRTLRGRPVPASLFLSLFLSSQGPCSSGRSCARRGWERCWPPACCCPPCPWPCCCSCCAGSCGPAGVRAEGDSQVPLHITVPQRVLSDTSGETDTLSYVLTVEGRPYTIHLKQQFFLPTDFTIYTYNETGSLRSDSPLIKGDCYYHGYIEGVPGSAVTLSTCAGLRGLLQFHNASYGIEPLGSSPSFQHVVYPLGSGAAAGALLPHGHTGGGRDALAADSGSNTAHPALKLLSKHRREMLLRVILERSLYRHLGGDQYLVSGRVVQLISFLDSMFSSLNVTVTLSSMEVWRSRNKIHTAGPGEAVLLRFLDWKKSSALQRPHEVPYLLMYRDQADFVGVTSPGTLCRSDASGAVAVLQRAVTLESFSVLLAQLLGRSLGMGFDDGRGCRCPTRACIMESAALHISGAKAFSNCSAADLEQFLRQNPECPFLRTLLVHPGPKAADCGNGVVEHGEQCDCGGAAACAKDACCTAQCKLKPGTKCSLGPCCEKCQFKAPNTPCRPPADAQCDLPEFCNGSSASCPNDVYVQDGHGCEHGTGYCYHGHCQSAELQCQRLYGRGAKNAPLACYEEINSHQDRFGHCGNHPKDGYQPCSWLNLGCGKLVCAYPNRVPFTKLKGAIIYAQVQEHLCVSFDLMQAPTEADPILVRDGTKCGPGKVCMNGTCHPHSILKYDCNVQRKCHGHGVCNNKKNCHCNPGWSPPHCRTRGSAVGGSTDSGQQLQELIGHDTKEFLKGTTKNMLLLCFCLLVPLLICIVILVVKWNQLMRRCARSKTEAAVSAAEDTGSSASTESSGSSCSCGAGTEPEPKQERGSGLCAGESLEQ
ncbi:disintegrin and metalloproteinase domain-containing protein 32-like [Numida meleagris]|uniref:disintegrin and metalloproteinase domain-containing protein 32-like n=1 Tax=Numida meleagris TaxID=8996 RepID=UPI000B3DFF82|nr:disintegrin and metalloproteinase domain-containing protein 32-like [Numida meleagris]